MFQLVRTELLQGGVRIIDLTVRRTRKRKLAHEEVKQPLRCVDLAHMRAFLLHNKEGGEVAVALAASCA